MRTLTVILSLICMLFTANAAKADRRVAFVVGNGAYKNVAQLPNPAVDAKAMAGVLRNVGFDANVGYDRDSADFFRERLSTLRVEIRNDHASRAFRRESFAQSSPDAVSSPCYDCYLAS